MAASTTEPGFARRWPFLLAGLAAAAVTIIRAVGGGAGDLPLMVQGLDRPEIASVIYINWHALTAVFATLALANFASLRLAAPAARAIGAISAIVFGATCLLFLYFAWRATGSPFTFFPWIPLAGTALLSAFAAWRA